MRILLYQNISVIKDTYTLMDKSHTSTAPSLTQAKTVELLGDQHMSGTDFWERKKISITLSEVYNLARVHISTG